MNKTLPSKSNYDTNKWIYIPKHDTKYRYVLGLKAANPLFCIGINPSTATPNNLDPTLKSVERIANSNGYKSWVMFNVYPQRATDPNDLHKKLNKKLHDENMKAIEDLLNNNSKAVIWAAWGTNIQKRPYLIDCVIDIAEIVKKAHAKWFCVGRKSKNGHPHHPLYLKKDSPMEPFDIQTYLQSQT